MNTNPSLKATNAELMAPINSLVQATTQNVNAAMKNATFALNTVVNNAKKNSFLAPLATPVAASIDAMPSSGPSMSLVIAVGIMVIIGVLLVFFYKQIASGAKYITNEIKNLFGAGEKEVATIASDLSEEASKVTSELLPQEASKFVPGKKQVFNISENRYTYSDAEPLCRALGAELATYEQVQQAWEQGADWCNYGWVKGQGAVYPTQKASWEKLQTGTPDERMACGMPGVNGGYFDNPELRFGVNCYGTKPSESEHDLKVQLMNNIPPLTPEAVAQRKKELEYRANASQIGVLPFREGAWSE